jgi:hypothetical protein
MRTTDPDPKPFKPLGEKVVKAEKPRPMPKPEGPSGVIVDPKTGMMQTTSHKPHLGSSLECAIWQWQEAYNADAEPDFLP